MNIPLVKLGDVCEVLDARRVPIKQADRKPGSVPYYGASGVQDYVADYLFDEPLVLLGEDGAKWGPGERSAYRITGKAWVNNHAHVLRPREGMDSAYLTAYLNMKDLLPWISGVTVPKLTQARMKEIPLPLPPLAEQERIVAHLERTLGAIDAMEAKFREMAETAERHFRATLSETFAALSSAPAAPLGEVCETTSGGTPLKSHKEYYEGGTIPWLRSGEVCKKDIEAAECFITPAGMENSSAKLFPVNTVLVAMYGATAGQVGILRFPATTNQAICGILPSTRFVPEFLYYALLQQKAALVRRAVGGAQPNISQEKIREVVLPLPPLAEQERVVARLERAEGVSRRVEALAQEGVAQCGVYRRAVLSEAFAVGEVGGDE